MNKNQIEIIETFTELIVYTLEFDENSESEIYTIEKLTQDYETLIKKAKKSFQLKDIRFNDALFPLVAWIDEVILSSKYRDKKLWRKELLQKKFFNTSHAGSEFFQRLEILTPNAYALRLLYLYVLFLGFKGQYYKEEDAKKLESIFFEQKSLVRDDFLDGFPKMAFRLAYAQKQLPKKKSFKASYRNLWILIVVSLSVGLMLFFGSQAYLNGLLDKYNIF